MYGNTSISLLWMFNLTPVLHEIDSPLALLSLTLSSKFFLGPTGEEKSSHTDRGVKIGRYVVASRSKT